jgi:hypothetical protein
MAQVKLSRRWGSEQGAQLVEFALVLPLLLLVVLGIAEFGFIFMRYEVVTNAAREGARIAVLPGYVPDDVRTRVVAYANAGGVPGLTFPNILVEDGTVPMGAGVAPLSVKRVTVTFNHSYMFLGGIGAWFGASYTTVPLRAVSEMRTENP